MTTSSVIPEDDLGDEPAEQAGPPARADEPASVSARLVYDISEGSAEMKPLLGGKGAGVAEMTRLGVPVPDGFTVTTEACMAVTRAGGTWPDGLWGEIMTALQRLEERTGRRLGGAERPLLVSVRSGAVISMPGMMDTILNLGMSKESVPALAAEFGDERVAWDSYRRFISMYGEVVEGVPSYVYSDALAALKSQRGAAVDTELTAADLSELVDTFLALSREHIGSDIPTDPIDQLRRAIHAVFASWDNPRAAIYREIHHIPDDLGTAVNVMQMVFGNRGESSATGVCFTRNPSTGAKELYGEFLTNAQGEDVVAGIRTPRPLAEMEQVLPEAFADLRRTMDLLEHHYRDMQDIEFTVDDGSLYLLQTRTGKRTAAAAVQIAVDLVAEGVIDRAEALRRIDPASLDQLLHPTIDPAVKGDPLTAGLNASPGAAVGAIVLDAERAVELARGGTAVVLVRFETTPDDIAGVVAAQGVLTTHGGMTSHAAVVARGMGKPCVAGASGVVIDQRARTVMIGDRRCAEGDVITLDGGTGEVFAGELPLIEPELTDAFGTVLDWADQVRRLGVRANADTGADARRARQLGAEGIGLCRTEHMFMDAARLPAVRHMILADSDEERAAALDEILPMQQADFVEILTAMSGLPVTVRLLDPPLHEFLPSAIDQALEVQRLELRGGDAAELFEARALLSRIEALAEQNPMLGLRGVRLALVYPQIPEMQVRALARAVVQVAEAGGDPQLEIMIPLVGFAEELRRMRVLVERVMAEEFASAGRAVPYLIGTMIELPRAALTADQIAQHADFFSFGTNDLTQTTLGISRDDAEGAFLSEYRSSGVLPSNPFASVDESGVAQLVQIGVDGGRSVRADLHLGVCGEHGGDPASIAIFERFGLDYVSCSPFRVPIARLAAAKAVLAD